MITIAAIVMLSLAGCSGPGGDDVTPATPTSAEPEGQTYSAPGETSEAAPDGAEAVQPDNAGDAAPADQLTVEQAQTACNTALDAGYPGSTVDWAGGIQSQETDPESGSITFIVSGDIDYQESEDRGTVMTCSVSVPDSTPEVTSLEVA
ncbi:hypothetical protein [Pseudoclavibacter terrae]|uniref:Uncharacterized protein n=1 Tax=Pseudoclavibacter terrae TaxID=1530195 RepID=A0A7J5B4Q4_9MICO|nr:hypothetical protein [Pseudoclavibacter terrae]KAB1639126.1 hypothetical protein F8O03_01925 [Pseudoclavibacter terrae]